ncbi:MAG: (2Fe-2S)-binding protein [Pseudomonadota bacterium]|nr:(2Fe-2S)-binding protein [Pseudomonadota bacterium]
MVELKLQINGRACAVGAPPDARLLDVLRDDLGMKGTRFGCGSGDCGACCVLIDGRSLPACDTPMWAVAGKSVTTVEGLEASLREAFFEEQAAQCAYCSSGMLVAAAALLCQTPDPTDLQVRQALDGHLCRCGAHNRIVRAVLRAAQSQSQSQATT